MFKIIAGLNRNGEYAENLKLNLLRAIKSSDFNLLAYVISMGGEKHFNDTHVIQAIKSSFFTPYFDSQDNYTECQDYLIAHKKTPFKEIFFQDPSLNEKDAKVLILMLVRAIKMNDFGLLSYAVSKGGEDYFKNIRVIQAIKSSFNTPDFDSQDNYTECHNYLIAHKKTPFERIYNKKNRLHFLLNKRLYSIALRLIKSNPATVNVNYKYNDGNTPLHLAVDLHLDGKGDGNKKLMNFILELIQHNEFLPTYNKRGIDAFQVIMDNYYIQNYFTNMEVGLIYFAITSVNSRCKSRNFDLLTNHICTHNELMMVSIKDGGKIETKGIPGTKLPKCIPLLILGYTFMYGPGD
ncbi:MAG: hypothetical protein HRT90_11985 [Candidatus Margulisbacteria bacterium]|nr:hypothetical protein [Candidatus Margulisiibacteriota bacterium]